MKDQLELGEELFGLSREGAKHILKDLRIRRLIELIIEDIEQFFDVNQFEIKASNED